jgi:hypothetical protein
MVVVLAMASATAMAAADCGATTCAADKGAAVKDACCKAGDSVFACAKCSVVDLKAGKCAKCEAALKAMNVLTMKNGAATLCPCEAGCKCTIKADDAAQCSCGKAVVTIKCPVACKVEAPKVETK